MTQDMTVFPIVRDVFAGPGPVVHPESAPFWTALGEGRFLVQRCLRCGVVRFPIAPACHACLAFEFDWEPLAKSGTVHVAVLVTRRGPLGWRGPVHRRAREHGPRHPAAGAHLLPVRRGIVARRAGRLVRRPRR